MLYLHVSNRTENLLKHLEELFRITPRLHAFDRECFLVQSQGMERMISQVLARRFTSWCNFEFFLPLNFLRFCADRLGIQTTPDGYERSVLTWRLEELLRNTRGAEYRQVENYLQGDNVGLKRYQLAEKLANMFDQYQLMRPEMLAAWICNELLTKNSAEVWQAALWRTLVAQQEGSAHRGEMLQSIISTLENGADHTAALPQRLSVFGLSIMPPLFLRCLQGVSLHADVHLYALSPCREYWGDIESRKQRLLRNIGNVEPAGCSLDEGVERHPLLSSLGQQGRDFQRLLFDGVQFEVEFESYEDPLEADSPNLLRRLQSDLLRGELSTEHPVVAPDDTSIRIVSCHSRLREIAVLKEHIQRWLYEDPDLELRDIVVMAPDIQEYTALIPAVFHDIQHSISDRSLRRRNTLLATFVDFFTLFQGRFAWDELFDVMKTPAIAAKLRLSEPDLETLQGWVTDSGIRWGLSAEQRLQTGLPGFAEGSWKFGLERLLVGYAIDSEQRIDNVYPYPHLEGGRAEPLGGLCEFTSIVEQAYRDFSTTHTLQKWCELLLQYAHILFADDTGRGYDREYLELHGLLAELGESPGSFHTSRIEYNVIRCWLERTARETRSSSGFLRGHLTFCSMLPMRSIPFEVVCILGLNDGEFPANDHFSTFDLLGESHRPGDRSRRTDDRYQFLEALMAARRQLYLSYVGQSIKTNEQRPPSVVVSELLEVLQNEYGHTDPVVHHPLHPFSSRYFNGEDPLRLFSYDERYCRVAERLHTEPVVDESWYRGDQRRIAEVESISVSELLAFFRDPQRWFVKQCLGIHLAGEVASITGSEPFAPEGLDNYLLDQQLLDSLLAGADLNETRQKLRAEGRWPLGTPGDLRFEEKVAELSVFAERIASEGMGGAGADEEIDIKVAGYQVAGRLTNIHEGGILLYRYSKMKCKDIVLAWLHHLLYARAVGLTPVTVVTALDKTWRFSSDRPLHPGLETFVEMYIEGCRHPSPLYLEPGCAWVEKTIKGQEAIPAARRKLQQILDAQYVPELSLLLRGSDPMRVLNEDFETACRNILLPLWQRGQ